jgi:hypothetical protein
MTDNLIGLFVARFRDETPPRRQTQFHKVETVVDDDPISKCGRKFAPLDGSKLLYETAVEDDNTCAYCRDKPEE